MKKLLFFVLIFFAAIAAKAQIMENLKNKMKSGATNKASDFNTTRSNKEKGQNLNRQEKTSEELEGGSGERHDDVEPAGGGAVGSSATTEPAQLIYDFSLKAGFTTQDTGSDPGEEGIFNIGLAGIAQRSGSGFMINDVINGQILLLDDEQKQVYVGAGVVLNNDLQSQIPDGVKVLTPTGNKAMIFGMEAEEFLFIDGLTRVWISTSTTLNEAELKAYRQFEHTIYGMPLSMLSGLGGILVRTEFYDENGNKTSTLNLTSLTQEPVQVDLTGYQVVAN